jgi:hypothetical protein
VPRRAGIATVASRRLAWAATPRRRTLDAHELRAEDRQDEEGCHEEQASAFDRIARRGAGRVRQAFGGRPPPPHRPTTAAALSRGWRTDAARRSGGAREPVRLWPMPRDPETTRQARFPRCPLWRRRGLSASCALGRCGFLPAASLVAVPQGEAATASRRRTRTAPRVIGRGAHPDAEAGPSTLAPGLALVASRVPFVSAVCSRSVWGGSRSGPSAGLGLAASAAECPPQPLGWAWVVVLVVAPVALSTLVTVSTPSAVTAMSSSG